MTIKGVNTLVQRGVTRVCSELYTCTSVCLMVDACFSVFFFLFIVQVIVSFQVDDCFVLLLEVHSMLD